MAETVGVLQNRANLYGLDRNRNAREIRGKLTASSVLASSGEYNFQPVPETKEELFKSWTSIDYRAPQPLTVPNNKVVVHGPSKGKGQLNKHFDFGNSRDQPESDTYTISRTKEDYVPQGNCKPKVLLADRTVNWPDMAPQLAVDRSIGRSEYDFSFLQKVLPENVPDYPRINTNKVTMPHKDTKVKFNKTVNVNLGSDGRDIESETMRSYTAPSRGRSQGEGSVRSISENMLKMSKNSNVFRGGDYNNAKQAPGSTFTLDYGKRLATPSTVKFLPTKDEDLDQVTRDAEYQEEDDKLNPAMPRMIGKFLKEEYEGVYTEATRGKSDQTSAHFQFGTDDAGQKSVYKKDFLSDGRSPKPRVRFAIPPQGSEVLANDPQLSRTGDTTTGNNHAAGTFAMSIPANELQRKRSQVNMSKRHGNSAQITYDKDKHAEDRQISLAHESYVGPPSDFRALPPQKTDHRRYNYIETDVALPYRTSSSKSTEATTQFRPLSMDAETSRSRQMIADETNRSMKEWVRATHFVNGYVPMSFHTENKDLFSGNKNDVVEKPAAGKTEKRTPIEFPHHSHSDNTQDTRPEPGSNTARMGTPLRAFPQLPTHKASLMANDFPPLETRRFTSAQSIMIQQDSKLGNKPIASSHLFHTDTTGRRNFTTTAMSDYIKPELMCVGTPRNMASVQ